MSVDTTDAIRVVQNKSAESEAYMRQLHVWLGVASAGGAISMVSLAAGLPDPAYAIRFIAISLWLFLTGVVAAGASLLFLSQRASALEGHHASAHNRQQLEQAIRKLPMMISQPQRLADEANAERNELTRRSNNERDVAERSWRLSRIWSVLWCCALTTSALAFVFAFSWPLVRITFLGENIVP